MKAPVVIIGLGEMGGVFARGFLRCAYPVYPVLRGMDQATLAAEIPAPELVLLAVAEGDLQPALAGLPGAWRDRLVLLQNELLPGDWQAHGLEPTVISVWFEKKAGIDARVLVPSPVFGPKAGHVAAALDALGIPVNVLDSEQRLLFELVRKNLYIVGTNVAGLKTGGTVEELRRDHRALFEMVVGEVLRIQERLTGRQFDADALMHAVYAAFDGDPAHRCMGRSAPARLERALTQAAQFGLDVPTLKEIQAGLSA